MNFAWRAVVICITSKFVPRDFLVVLVKVDGAGEARVKRMNRADDFERLLRIITGVPMSDAS